METFRFFNDIACFFLFSVKAHYFKKKTFPFFFENINFSEEKNNFQWISHARLYLPDFVF